MSNFNTLHIFGYGETQLIKKDYNKKIKTSELTKATALINEIISKSGKTITPNSYHSITVFSGFKTNYVSKTEKEENFYIETAQISTTKLNALITEIENKIAAKEAEKQAEQE